MRTVSEKFPNHMKFVSYHVPIYTTFPDKDIKRNLIEKEANASWIPIFDKYKFLASFENHDHTYKICKPMVNNVYDVCGTHYVGNGAWGIEVRTVKVDISEEKYKNYLKVASLNHFWLLTIEGNGSVNATSVDVFGKRIDYVNMTRDNCVWFFTKYFSILFWLNLVYFSWII